MFIDDSEPNIVAARKFGMQAIVFTSPEQLRKDLSAGSPLQAVPLKAKAAASSGRRRARSPAKKASRKR